MWKEKVSCIIVRIRVFYQAGIRQIDKIAPSAPMSFQTDSMIPIGSLQPSSNSFPTGGSGNESGHHHPYPGLPHAPTMQQAKDLGPVSSESPMNPALVMSQAAPMMQRPDPFGATPFLPPPPASSKSNRAGAGGQGRYQFPPEIQQSLASNGEDRYAAFEFLAGSSSSGNAFVPASGGQVHLVGPPAAADPIKQQQPPSMNSSMGMMVIGASVLKDRQLTFSFS